MVSLSVPSLRLGSELFPRAAGAQSSSEWREAAPRRAPSSEPYHELGMAVLEGAPRVPVALLLAVHHATLHGVLDLGRENRAVPSSPGLHPRRGTGRQG